MDYVCAWIHTCWNIFKQLLNSKGDTGLPNNFLFVALTLKPKLVILFYKPWINIGRKNPHSPKSHDAFMPHPTPCSFGLLQTYSLEIIQISSLLKCSISLGIDGINPP